MGGQCMTCLLSLATETDHETDDAHDAESPPADEFLRRGIVPRFDDYELVDEIARGGMGLSTVPSRSAYVGRSASR